MKKADIRVGGLYTAKVNNRLVTVRVDAIEDGFPSMSPRGGTKTHYCVTNLTTGRKTTFRSAVKFREEVITADGEPFGQRVGPDGLLPSYKAHMARKAEEQAEETPPSDAFRKFCRHAVEDKGIVTVTCPKCGATDAFHSADEFSGANVWCDTCNARMELD